MFSKLLITDIMILACNSQGSSFRAEINRARSSGISSLSALGDIIDGSITQYDSNSLAIKLSLKTGSIINRIMIHDTNERGFEGIDKDGPENPFTFGKLDHSHEEDSKVSEYGIGFKRGLLVLCDSVNIYTNATMSDGTRKFIHIEFLFQEMANKDFGEDFKPTCIEEITRSQFLNKNNNNEYGSTIILNELVKNDFSKSFKKTRQLIKEYIGRVYPSFIRNGIKITVDTHEVEPHISPLDIDDYYHKIHEVNMNIVLDNEDDDIVAVIGTDKSECYPKPALFKNEGKEFKSKPDKNISVDDLERKYYNNKNYTVITLKFALCNTQGYSKYNFNNQGSLEIVRKLDDKNSRLLTSPYLVSGNGMPPGYYFKRPGNLNEYAYHWGRITFSSKKLNKYFNQTNCKYISTNFNYNLLTHVLSFYEKKLRGASRVGSATTFQKNWNKLYGLTKDQPYIFELNKSIENNIKIAEAIKKKNKEDELKIKQKLIKKEEVKRVSKEDTDKFLDTGVRESFGDSVSSDEDKKLETSIETLTNTTKQAFPDKNLDLSEIVVNDTTSSDESDTESVRSNTSQYLRKTQNKFAPFGKLDTKPKHELYFDLYGRKDGGKETFKGVRGGSMTTMHSIKYTTDEDGYILGKIGLTNQSERAKGSDYGGRMTTYARGFVSSTKIQAMKEGLLKHMINNSMHNVIPLKKDNSRNEWFKIKEEDLNKFAAKFYQVLID